MEDLAKQLRQLQDAQRLRELTQQYGYSQQDINRLRQTVPQALPQLLGRQPGLPPVQMPTIPSSQMTLAEMEMLRRSTPGYQSPAPSFKDIFFNPGQVMRQNYIDPAVIEQMYYRGLLSQ